MIISASRRTDIPSYYGEWFLNRLREGYFTRINPYNRKQIKAIEITSQNTDGIVFWTKDASNFMECLGEIEMRGFTYIFLYTLNDYPLFEKLQSLEKRIENFIEISDRIGRERISWRYDPIIISDKTPYEYHKERFEYIASKIGIYTSRVVTSFLQFYGKVKSNLSLMKEIAFRDARENEKQSLSLIRYMKEICSQYNTKLQTCAESLPSIQNLNAPCIDASLLQQITGNQIPAKKDPSQRENCLCCKTIDIGMYDTCPHGCLYCYANMSSTKATNNFKRHNPKSGSIRAN